MGFFSRQSGKSPLNEVGSVAGRLRDIDLSGRSLTEMMDALIETMSLEDRPDRDDGRPDRDDVFGRGRPDRDDGRPDRDDVFGSWADQTEMMDVLINDVFGLGIPDKR